MHNDALKYDMELVIFRDLTHMPTTADHVRQMNRQLKRVEDTITKATSELDSIFQLKRTAKTLYSRIWAAPLWVNCGQVSTLGHEDVKLSELLNVVDGELDISLNLNVPKVSAVHGHHAPTQLGANRSPHISYDQLLVWCIFLLG